MSVDNLKLKELTQSKMILLWWTGGTKNQYKNSVQDADPSKWSLTNLIGSLESGGTFWLQDP